MTSLQNYFTTSTDLKQATTDYFGTELGFNFENLKTSNQPISVQIQQQNYDLQIVFQLTDEELRDSPLEGWQTQSDGVDFQTEAKYSKYLVCCYDFGRVEKIPSKSLLANFNRKLSAKFEARSGMPNLIVFRYTVNDKTYITFSISELRESPNKRTGKYIATKVILLKDIDIQNTHRAHLDILKQLQGKYKSFDELHDNWLKVLNIKELSDQFYRQVKEKYDDLVENLQLPPLSNPTEENKKDFSLRLVGRLIFCWFLKAKGWIPETLLSPQSVDTKYYHNILEPLFFESLNKDPKDRNFEDKEKFKTVPYLNGGLFEAKHDDYYKAGQKEQIDKTNHLLIVPNNQIKDIFKLFEEYYFTIDENTSTEQEIGVDPEMMGRIFENFILNRSSTGSFYTPREIVDYMVQTSLKELLKTKSDIAQNTIENLFDTKYWSPTESFKKDFGEKILNTLNTLKILDPACGSGAFPMGVLQKLTEIIHTLQPEKSLYEIKLQILQNCIYGVDIMPIAVEISRLRCWLSLVVDEDKEHPELLPNLEFKFVCANSLVGIDDEVFTKRDIDDIFGEAVELNQIFLELVEIRKNSFNPGIDKSKLRQRWDVQTTKILDKIISLQQTKLSQNQQKYKHKEQDIIQEATKLINWNPFDNTPSQFFDPEWMFGETGFDLVIGNPPYVGEKGNKDTFEPLKKSELGRRFYQGKMDLFYFFFHLGLEYAKTSGIISFITTNYYITATGGTKLRSDIKQRSNVLKLINFGELKIFESALGQHNLITLLQKKPNLNETKNSPLEGWQTKSDGVFASTIISQNKGYLGSTVLENIINGTDPNTSYYQISQDKLFDENGYMKLTSGGIDDLLDKMLVGSKRLGEVCEVNQGIVTGADKVSPKHLRKYQWKYKHGDGIYVLSDKEADNFINKSYFKKWFKNSDVNRFTVNNQSSDNIIYFENGETPDQELLSHLEKFRENLIERREVHKGSRQWYELWWSRKKDIFESPKIVAPQRSKTNTFGYNETAWYAASDVFFITQPKLNYKLKFLLGVLNSKLIYNWLYYRGKRKGEMLELTATPLSEIPIPKLDTPEKQSLAAQIEDLVEQIISIKNEKLIMKNVGNTPSASLPPLIEGNLSSDVAQGNFGSAELRGDTVVAYTTSLENKIDELVFELYGLSGEERAVVLN
ncbi:MAG: DNA methyltransferase [bacterium]